jgi:hypothetical protein
MTISSTTRVAGPFNGSGTTAAFPFSFKVFDPGDLYVVSLNVATGVIATLALTTDYTVALNADQDATPGGSITLTAGNLASGYTLTITTDMDELQSVDLTNGGGFYPDVINGALDTLTILIQQLQAQLARCLQLPVPDAGSGTVLSAAAVRANKYLGFDASGNLATLPFVASTPSYGLVVVTYSATPTFNPALGSVLKMVLTGNVTSSSFTGAAAGTFVSIRIVQDAVGGRTFAWPANLHNAGAVSLDANAVSDQLFAIDQDGSGRAVGPIMYS